jgi:5'(3')-deoxyribonucleotidase
MRILVDVDNVLCNFTGPFVSVLNYTTGKHNITPDQVTDFDFRSVASQRALEWAWTEVDNTKGWCASLPALSGIDHQLRILRSAGHEVVAVTAPRFGPYWMHERAQWLFDHGFGKNEAIFTHAKQCVTGDVFIDDSLENVQKWTAANQGLGILVDAPWNQHGGKSGFAEGAHNRTRRVKDLKEAVDIIQDL